MSRGWTPLGVALAFALLAYGATHLPQVPADYAVLWTAARDLAGGRNPYATPWTDWPLFYPLPAILAVLPLAWLPYALSHAAWVGLGAGCLALAARAHPGLVGALLSAGMMESAVQGQWGPLLTAGVVLPWLSVVWVAKPSIALALFCGWPRWWVAGVAGGIVAVTVLLWPSWPADWLASIQQSNHVPPVMRPWGFVLLVALLRWRAPEARMVAALACIPHTASLYETLPLFLCCRTRWEGYGLAALSYVAAFGRAALTPEGSTLVEAFAAGWPALFGLAYLPAVLLVLRPERG